MSLFTYVNILWIFHAYISEGFFLLSHFVYECSEEFHGSVQIDNRDSLWDWGMLSGYFSLDLFFTARLVKQFFYGMQNGNLIFGIGLLEKY